MTWEEVIEQARALYKQLDDLQVIVKRCEKCKPHVLCAPHSKQLDRIDAECDRLWEEVPFEDEPLFIN